MLDINRFPFITVQRYGANNSTVCLQFVHNLSTYVMLNVEIEE